MDALQHMVIHIGVHARRMGRNVSEVEAIELATTAREWFASEWQGWEFILAVLAGKPGPGPTWRLSPIGTPSLVGEWESVAKLCAASVRDYCQGISIGRLVHRARELLIDAHRSGDPELQALAPDFITACLLTQYGRQ